MRAVVQVALVINPTAARPMASPAILLPPPPPGKFWNRMRRPVLHDLTPAIADHAHTDFLVENFLQYQATQPTLKIGCGATPIRIGNDNGVVSPCRAGEPLNNNGQAVVVGSGWAAWRLFVANSAAVGKISPLTPWYVSFRRVAR